METSKEKGQEVLEQYGIEGIRDLIIEEDQLMKREISIGEALNLIMNRESQPAMKEEEGSVEKYVEKRYTLQATFLSELEAIEARARVVFIQLPQEERNLSTVQN